MGSPCELIVYAEDPTQAQVALLAAQAEVFRLEGKYSRYRPDTITQHINTRAGSGEFTPLDTETHKLIELARYAYEISDGLFDLTAGVYRQVWDFRAGVVPTQASLSRLIPLVGWNQVLHIQTSELDVGTYLAPDAPSGWSFALPEAGMEIDFGGLVKEYAADAAAGILLKHGVKHGLVDLGGDFHILGPHPTGKPWQVGIRDPDNPGQPIRTCAVAHGGVATSGYYERFIQLESKRHYHILNPRTGWSVEGLASVTVTANPCVVAGITSTVAMLKGREGVSWLQQLGVAALCVTADREVLTTTSTIT